MKMSQAGLKKVDKGKDNSIMDFSLELPNVEEVKSEVVADVTPTPQEKQQITSLVSTKVTQIATMDLDSQQQRNDISQVFQGFGDDILKQSERKNQLLEKRLVTMGNQSGEGSIVAKGLEDLNIQMKDLDPSGIDFLKTGPFGKLFNPARRYFEKFKTADQEISEIVESLDKGKKILTQDNTALQMEQGEMRELTKKLTQSIEMGMQLDSQVSSEIEMCDDPDRKQFIEEELLYPLRQRIEDFQQLLVVNQQGIVAMEIVRRNNRELINSVNRAKMVTVSALRTAVMVAQALYDQKIVMEKINALNKTTNAMISATSKMLKQQGTEIHNQANNTAVNADTLKVAFAETLSALDDISSYKQQALPIMKQTIADFQSMAESGEKAIQRLEKSNDYTE